MNKRLNKVAAVALAAAMVSSAFAMSTATAFATAPTLPTAKAQLENSTVYMAKGGNTTVNVTKAVTSNLFKELDANSTAANLNIKSVTTTDVPFWIHLTSPRLMIRMLPRPLTTQL